MKCFDGNYFEIKRYYSVSDNVYLPLCEGREGSLGGGMANPGQYICLGDVHTDTHRTRHSVKETQILILAQIVTHTYIYTNRKTET